jgi:hypothetical protein
MKISRFSAFSLGVIITAASVGTISFAAASSNVTIKACANKKSGAIRYLAKGKCKKTEKMLSWNQTGPQGAPAADVDTAVFARKADVVSNVVKSVPIEPSPLLPVTLVPGDIAQTPTATDLLGSSARSFTRRYDIPLNWVGRISGSCPSEAPIPLTYGVYALDGNGVKMGEDGWPRFGIFALGSRAQIRFEELVVGVPGGVAGSGGNPPMTLYVSQVCGAITNIVQNP